MIVDNNEQKKKNEGPVFHRVTRPRMKSLSEEPSAGLTKKLLTTSSFDQKIIAGKIETMRKNIDKYKVKHTSTIIYDKSERQGNFAKCISNPIELESRNACIKYHMNHFASSSSPNSKLSDKKNLSICDLPNIYRFRNNSFDDKSIIELSLSRSSRNSTEDSKKPGSSASRNLDLILPKVNEIQRDHIKVDDPLSDNIFKPKINTYQNVQSSYRKFLKNVSFKSLFKKMHPK